MIYFIDVTNITILLILIETLRDFKKTKLHQYF